VTAAPLAIKLAVSGELVPTATLPKAKLVGETVSVPAAVPVPENAIDNGEFEAFDTTDKLPLAAPAPVGVKVAVKVRLWFGVRVAGSVNPLIENIAPVTFA
jgi:hypothetical protein